MQVDRVVYGYDADWQYPAITEQHAFHQMKKKFFPKADEERFAYIGFPWATLIDLKRQKSLQTERISKLESELAMLVEKIGGRKKVITVCQQVYALQFQRLFESAGITDLFWAHAAKNQFVFPKTSDISIHPFPLYPVQQVALKLDDIDKPRKYLFSFVGAKSNDFYLTKSRNLIYNELGEDPRGIVLIRDSWHYNKIVYDTQIRNNLQLSGDSIDEVASMQFQSIMSHSIFSLCPSGTGPNSIRLWESALNGSIPVILADTYRHPGDDDLWNLATVSCPENEVDIRNLPDKLNAIASDPEMLHRKRMALYLLMQKYGPDSFVDDILDMMRAAPPHENLAV